MKSSTPNKTIRCAIYTRKSSEEGLEQDFNSLDARGKLVKLISRANSMRGGYWIRTAMTMGDFQAALWSTLPSFV